MTTLLQRLKRTTSVSLTGRRWDVIIVGAGHNGLTAAAYLARAGKSVLVLERRDRIGGAATAEEMWPEYVVSPCAYLVGLFHDRVIDELDLRRRGLEIVIGDPTMFVPFNDGQSFTIWKDGAATIRSLQAFAPDQVAGWIGRQALFDRLREALRPAGDRDLWLEPEPTRREIKRRLEGDPVALATVFSDSQMDNLERFFTDQRLLDAFASQGVIGINASPFDPGTAAVDFHHSSGRQEGMAGEWGFVIGGMGAVSAVLADAAEEAGALIVCDAAVSRIEAGEGVVLANGDHIEANAVVSNADPVRTAGLMRDAAFTALVGSTPIESATMKVTFALAGLPDFGAAEATNAQVQIAHGAESMHQSYLAAKAGRISDELWCELYFQTPYDPSIAPPGRHVLSAFCQYVPYTWADGRSWDAHRASVSEVVTRSIERFAPGFADLVEHAHVQGPPDLEAAVGLTGGHIFHGDIRAQHMWDKRMPYRTGVEAVYLCGASTHPGGGVIGVNGRNAATIVLRDLDNSR